jgi:DNA-directed RNA polymerase subunit RPC12/RpoP
MNCCPHCKANANPVKLLTMTRRAPYRCGRCGGRSLLQPRDNTLAALLTLVIVIPSGVALLRFGFPTGVGCFLGLYVFLIGGVMWFFMRLRT